MRLKIGCKYLVIWYDITTDNLWRTRAEIYKEIDKIEPTQNTWTYIGSHGNFKLFTSGSNSDGEYYDYHAIPKEIILKVKQLK